LQSIDEKGKVTSKQSFSTRAEAEAEMEPIDTTKEKVETKPNGKQKKSTRADETPAGQVPAPAQISGHEQGGAEKAVEVAPKGKRGEGKPAKRGGEPGERPSARLEKEGLVALIDKIIDGIEGDTFTADKLIYLRNNLDKMSVDSFLKNLDSIQETIEADNFTIENISDLRKMVVGLAESRTKKVALSPAKLPGVKLTNEEITQKISSVTSTEGGEVKITGEITDDILEAANQYKSGGVTKEGRGILDEYYTSTRIVDMVKSLFDFPVQSMKVLEPAVGTGNFLYALPETGTHEIVAHEINDTTARIAKIFHQNAKVFTTSFEENFIDERGNKKEFAADYDLVIGNPPYGEHRGKYLGLGELSEFKKYEEYFIARGLSVLKKGGKLAMVVPSSFLRSGENKNKIMISTIGVVDVAFRLPNGAFEGTDVGTDILIMHRRDPQTEATDLVSLVSDNYFKDNPANILGTTKKQKNRFGGLEDHVTGTLDNAIDLFYQKNNASQAIAILKELGAEQTQENIETTEEAIDEAGDKAKELVKVAQKKGKETIEKKIVKKATKEGEPVSLMSQFEGQFSDAEIEAWKDTQADGSLKNPKKHKDFANFMGGKWYIDFNYAQGDIYEKLHVLDHDLGVKNITKEQYEKQKAKLEAVKPRRESIDDLKLAPNINFVNELKLGVDGTNGNELTLRTTFLYWLHDLPRNAFGDSSQYEVREYVNNEQVRGSDKDRNELIRVRRKTTADSLFAKFLKEGLDADQKEKVESLYNETFNFYHMPDYKQVPMFSNIFPTFNGVPFELRDVQKHGVGKLINSGVGIIAHDVGFGKTISGVVAVNEALHRGWAKRPIIIAPNENVYQQWINTINELVPNAKLNTLGNLGVGFKGDLSTLKIDEGTITLLTYEGFKRLGFNDDTYTELSSKFGYISDDLEKHKSTRDEEKRKAKMEETGGTMKRGTRADLSFEDLGFDHITFDEVHNANHIVSKVKIEKGKSSEFNQFALRPSDLGVKTWLAAQYVQSKNDGRNVNLLSATPFTNHPLEYYSILSLVADKSLQKMGLQNVNDFFGTFMEAESDYEFKADGTYQKKTDIRRFRNFRQFRKLLDTYIDFKEGETEGIVRPTRVQQTYEIPQNQLGLEMEEKAQAIFKENEKESGQGAKVLRAITELRKIAFSPYASKFSPDIAPTDYKLFVENSPKLNTLMSLISQNKKDKDEAGQIVYVDQVGVEFLPLMKEYLVKEVGYSQEEVDIISGATAKPKRGEIQNKYNAGTVKVLLGSAAIKEGMNLQENTSDLYILSLPWNFTQLRQVIGRGWRQGNRWKNVRINNLFIQDSVDIFLSQKLENKQKRYEAAIKSGDQEVDVGDVSFNELKFDLIRDPETRARLELQAEKERLSQEITQEKAELAFATRKLEKINEIAREIVDTTKYLEQEKAKEEPAEYWVEKYTKDLTSLKKQQAEELGKLKEKGIDTDTLIKKRTEGEAKIKTLEEQEKALDENFDMRLKEIASSMPERKPYSQAIIDGFVADRATQNQTFYKLVADEVDEVIKVEEKVKEIKNAAGTKVVKTKKTTEVNRAAKPKPAKEGAPKDTAIFAVLKDDTISASDKVDKILDVKQKGKEFKDIGERVAGSKKERAAIRTVMESGSSDVFSEMVKRLGLDAVLEVLDKNEILDGIETPNPEKDKEAGIPSLIAFTKKDVYDSIQRRFSFRQGRGRYKSFVAYRQPEGSAGWSSVDTSDLGEATEIIKAYPEMLREFVKKLTSVTTAKEMAAFWQWYRSTYSQYDIGSINGTKLMTKNNVFGDGIENYKAHVPVIWSGDTVYATRKSPVYFDQSLTEKEQALFDKELNDERWWAKAIKKGGKKEVDTEIKHGNFKPLDHIERSATPIPDEKITPEILAKEYGFKSVQFGNYMDDATSKEHIRHTIGALEDMAILLDIDIPKVISATGLSMAYGARGGGGANAHYEPTKNIINLTKGRGDGSFFHEFIHYMDTQLGGRYRGKWSSKKDRWYVGDTLDEAAVKLMQTLVGARGRKQKEFTPQDDPYIRDNSPVMVWYRDNLPFDEAISYSKGGIYEQRGSTKVLTFPEAYLYQDIANIYRKTVRAEVDFYREDTNFYEGSKNYGGDYWSRPEELLARAGQAYIEDKMIEKGMTNNYLTRTTIGEEGTSYAKVYPQGEERIRFAEAFDKLFAELRQKYPRTETKFKREGEVSATYTVTDAARYLEDLKERLNLDFDVHFVDNILARRGANPFSTHLRESLEAYGATTDNTIAIVKEMAAFTAEHESVHLTLANLDKIPTFKKNGLTRESILRAKAQQMGIELTKGSATKIEEELATDFEAYVASKHEPKGIIKKFFALLRQAIIRFARAIAHTSGDIITDYFDILSEGIAVNEEMIRLENKGIVESYIEDGVFYADNTEVLLNSKVKPMEDIRANQIADQIEQEQNVSKRNAILNNLTNEEVQSLAISNAAGRIWRTMEEDFAAILDSATTGIEEEVRFKLKEEGDKHLQKLQKTYNDLISKQEKVEAELIAWKTSIDQEIIRREEAAQTIDEATQEVKELARFTTRVKPPVGSLTARGVEMVETLGFANKEAAQEELGDYLKRKTELVETRNKLRKLRIDISKGKTTTKENRAALRDVERRLKLRKRLLEQKDFYVGVGMNRGKKEQMRMIRLRGRAIRNVQDAFMLSDKKAKDIVANRRIHLMAEAEFNDFLLEFTNKAEQMRNILDARDAVRAIEQEKDLGKIDNLRKAMGLPATDKMTDEQANRFVDALSKYQFGDTFLTQRELETVHRTKWGEIRTERELLAKLKEHVGVSPEEFKTLETPMEGGKYTPWVRLARKHPFFDWLVSKRIEALVKSEREYTEIETEVNKLANEARSSRRNKMSLKERAIEMVVPTDDLVFGYMEAENKAEYAKKNDLTNEELAFADYLTTLYFDAYGYMKAEYGMKGRENYMTHMRRSFLEALKEEGVMVAFREMITSQKEDEAAFKITDEETGSILAFEKFFKYAMRRSGQLVPSKNVANSSLAYFKAFTKKRTLDEFIPEAMLAVQAHKSLTGMTEKGLPKDPTIETFVKKFLNDAKGRKISYGTKQGSNFDIVLRTMITWVSLKYLGGNLASAIGNMFGDFIAISVELDVKEQARGIMRTVINPMQAHEINKQFRSFTGKNPITEIFEPRYNTPERIKKSLMALMGMAAFQSNKFFLRSKMTDEEFRTGVIEDARLAEIAKALSRIKPNEYYIKSLVGNTTAGTATSQFMGWAIVIFNTVVSDAQEVVKMLKERDVKKALTSREAQKVMKFVIVANIAFLVASMISVDDGDDSFYAKMIRSIKNNLNTLTQALTFMFSKDTTGSVTLPSPAIITEISTWLTALSQIISQERYKQDGKGYGIGDLKWINTAERAITPSALRQLFPKVKEHTKNRLLDEAVQSGKFDAEMIASTTNPDEWNNVKGERTPEEQATYQKNKIGEIKTLYHLQKDHPGSKIGEIITEETRTTQRIEKMVQYAQEVGKDKAYSELKDLYKDRNLCTDVRKKTGCVVSGKLFKEFKKATKNL
jgi:hypothetical protein